MAWEKHINTMYYYRARRKNGRIIKEYIGRGEAAERAAAVDAAARARRAANSARRRAERLPLLAMIDATRTFEDYCRTMTEATLLASGFHRHHRGQWRRPL